MAPITVSTRMVQRRGEVTKPTDPLALIVEGWAQGFMVGSIMIMICITICNLRSGVLLHKLILLELILGTFHGTFIFFEAPIYGWYLSITAIPLIISWNLHNVVAWIKVKPFIGRKTSLIFIWTVILVQPYWILEIYADFTYFNNINKIYLRIRVFEALFRDPWWVFTTCCLLYNIRTRYEFTFFELVRKSPRLAIMLGAMILSIIFIIIDICAVTNSLSASIPIGINPFWKLAFVFKLLTDSVILDDFKTALDKLSQSNMSRVQDQWGRWGRDSVASKHMPSSRGSAVGLQQPAISENKASWAHLDGPGRFDGPRVAAITEIRTEGRHSVEIEEPVPAKCLNK